MTGGTHITIGIASSLAILQPKTIPECLCAATGGLIGGMICDIDSPGKRDSLDYRDDPYGWQIYSFIALGLIILLTVDYFAGNGAVYYIINNWGIYLFVGGIAFITLSICGALTHHRTFTHSVLAGILFTVSVICFCKPLAIPFAIGFASHLILDFFNRRKVQYLWPFPWKFGLNRYPSDGRLNDSLFGIGLTTSVFLFVYFFINSLSDSILMTNIIRFFSQSVNIWGFYSVPLIIPYLIGINILGFVVYVIDYNLYMRGLGFYKGSDEDIDEMASYIMTLLLVIDLAGGMLGKLLAVFVLLKGKFYKAEKLANFNLYIIPLCILFDWIAILFTFFIPSFSEKFKPFKDLTIANYPIVYFILGYFIIINITTMLLFPKMKRFGYTISPREKVCMILSMLGGAAGGYISMKISGNHENSVMLSSTLPEMMVMHAIVLMCLLHSAF